MKTERLKSWDGKELVVYIWDDVAEPKAVVQLIHGMNEYCQRYDRFAKALNAAGFIVFADDHRGHGRTASAIDKIGKNDGSRDLFIETLRDEIFISDMLIDKYKLPLLIFGHSYGSFIAQGYIQQYRKAAGAVICGSADMKGPLLAGGLFLARAGKLFKGADAPAKLIDNINFSGYNKKIKKAGGSGYWLTRDTAIAEEFYANQYCGKIFSYGFYVSFFKGLNSLYKKGGLEHISKKLPVFLIAGEKDGVGGNGRLVAKLYDRYKKLGLNVQIKIYEECRHELTNELNKEEIDKDIIEFYNGAL